MGLIPGWGRPPREGNGNPLQYFCWIIPWTKDVDRLQSIGSQKIWTQLSTHTVGQVFYKERTPVIQEVENYSLQEAGKIYEWNLGISKTIPLKLQSPYTLKKSLYTFRVTCAPIW